MRLSLLSLMLFCGTFASAADGLAASFAFQSYPTGQSPYVDRIDPVIDLTSPTIIAGYPTTNWNGTWTGTLTAPIAGSYTFTMTCDDAARLWVKDRWLITKVGLRGGSSVGTATGTLILAAGEKVPVLFRLWQLGGNAKAKLEWTKPGDTAPSVVPSTSLSTSGWTRIETPTASYESPASIVCWKKVGYPATVKNGATTIASTVTGPTTVAAEIPLSPTAAAAVALTSGGETASATITWQTLDLAAPPAHIDVRPGAKLLVKPTGSNKVFLAQGYSRTQVAGTPDALGRYTVTIPTAGTWNVDDGGAATTEVAAIALDVPAAFVGGTLLIQCDNPTIFPVSTIPANAYSLVTTGSFEHLLFVTEKPITNGLESSVTVGALDNDFIAYVRIKSTGAIVALPKTRGYYTLGGDATALSTDPDGTDHATSEYILNPFLKNLNFVFSMRAHTATFKGGAKSFSVKSDGSATSIGTPGFVEKTQNGITYGSFNFDVIFPPGETKWCYTAVGKQIAK